MLASMIFRKEPFFHGHDNYDQVPLLFQTSKVHRRKNVFTDVGDRTEVISNISIRLILTLDC